jgi:glycosyltransferase involved in cell wall biosynthesis
MKTRFTVIIPSYNREKLIAETVNSILSQTFKDFEVIVVDDGSKDGTREVLQSFGAKIKLILQMNQGAEAARTRGAAEANGEYLLFLDDDDLLFPWSLAVYDKIIREMNSPPLVLGQMSYFESGATPWNEGGDEDFINVLKFPDYISKDVTVGLSCSRFVIQKITYDASEGVRNSFKGYPLDDHHLMLSIGTASPFILVTRPTTVAHRVHASNFSTNTDLVVQGVSRLIDFERKGLYPGGSERRFGRYSCIGGLAWCWCGYAFKRGHYALGLGLLAKSCPHLVAGTVNKIRGRVKSAAVPVRLPR